MLLQQVFKFTCSRSYDPTIGEDFGKIYVSVQRYLLCCVLSWGVLVSNRGNERKDTEGEPYNGGDCYLSPDTR